MKTVGLVLATVLLLAGCSGSDGSDDGPAPETTRSVDRDQLDQQARDQAEQSQQAQQQLEEEVAERAEGTVVDIAIQGGEVSPQGGRVEVEAGTPVTLRVTSDVAEQIHVHSDPEHTYEVAAGGTVSRTFTVGTPGQVAVEAHGLDVTIVQLVVRP